MQERRKNIHFIMRLSIIAGLYVVLTYALNFISFGEVQFRIAEILMLLCFFNKKYSYALILGCFISNLFSPYGLPDIIFGTLATAVACLGIVLFRGKYLWLASTMVPIGNIIVGLEIVIVNSIPWPGAILTILSVFIGEFVVVCLIGVPIFKWLMKNDTFKELILNI
jgi:uncharacterized membrane protein